MVGFREGAKEGCHPDPDSDDQMEQFLAQNTSEQLEQFIYEKSKQRVCHSRHAHGCRSCLSGCSVCLSLSICVSGWL